MGFKMVKTYHITMAGREFQVLEYGDGTFELPPELARWRGYGTALKPSWEPILVYRKPFKASTIAQQVLDTGTGGLNIDATRVKHSSPADLAKHIEMVERIKEKGGSMEGSWKNSSDLSGASDVKTEGRWPPNLILCHHPGCKQVGTQEAPAPVINRFDDGMKPFGEGAGHPYTQSGGGVEQVAVYDCVEGCPVRMLNEQSGGLKSGSMKPGPRANRGGFSGPMPEMTSGSVGDSGGASRFFPSFEGQEPPAAPFFYTGKATGNEKNKGVEKLLPSLRLRDDLTEDEIKDLLSKWSDLDLSKDIPYLKENVPKETHKYFEACDTGGNQHPCVKPLVLMEWLVKLACPKGGTVLDPYCGSGSTCVAAAQNGMHFIGIDRDVASCETAAKRTGVAQEERNSQDHQRGIFDELFGGDDS